MLDKMIEMAIEEGRYQNIEVDGEVVSKGYRNCDERWDIIKPHIKNHQTIMDIGSHYGFFAIRAAREYPNTLVWSVEETSKRADIQKLALTLNGLDNVVLSMESINLLNMLKLQRTCESLDTILALSVIHYFPLEEIPEIIWAFSRLAQNLIIEFPSPDEDDVANKNLVDELDPEYLLGLMYDSVTKIGETSSSKHRKVMRPIYLCQNYKITRENCMSYFDSKSGGHHTVEYKNLEWTISGNKKKYNGLNVANLRHFNPVYPRLSRIFNEAGERYYNLIQDNAGGVTDIHPRNLIYSHNGVFPIDYTEFVRKRVYDMDWKIYKNKVKHLTQEGISTLLRQRYEDIDINPIIEPES